MRKYQVFIIAEAEQDLLDIYHFVALHDSVGNAGKLLQKLEAKCASLARFPNRGSVPQELVRIGVFDYREIFYKAYRIIYQVQKKNVYIHCILDGRRDLQELLQHRLLR